MSGQARRLAVIMLISVATEGATSTASAQNDEPEPKWFSGALDFGADFYASDRETDFILNQTLRLQIDPRQWPKLHLNGAVWLTEDLDGDEAETSVLFGLDDTYDHDFRARLLYLHLDIEDVWGDSVLRLGRQRILESVAYNRIDGAYFRQYRGRWDWYAFGGFLASLYDTAHDDPVLGGGVGYRANERTRIALDTFYAEEHRSRDEVVFRRPLTDLLGLAFPRRVQRDLHETAAALSVWHDITPTNRVYARYFWKDGNGDELRFLFSGLHERSELSYELAVRTQLNAAGDQVSDLGTFFRVLGRFEPYYNIFAALHRPISERVLLSLEAEFHDAENDDPFSANRDFQRYALIASVEDIAKDTDISAAIEYWGVESGEGSWAVTGEIGREWGGLRAALGADFERYEDRFIEYNSLPSLLGDLGLLFAPQPFARFTPFLGLFSTRVVETHENVYSIFAHLDWARNENEDVRLRIRWEEDDGPDSPYWRVRAGYTIRF